MGKRKISPQRRFFRRILLFLAFISFIFAAFMSFYYVGHKNGYLKQEDVAPTVFATDVYLYKTKAYWSDTPEKYQIAEKLYRLGFFDNQYYNASHEMMTDMADDGYEPAMKFVAVNYPDRKP